MVEIREIMPNQLDAMEWRRSGHVLNMITLGQVYTIKGEETQNPYYTMLGCHIMLSCIAAKFKEKKTIVYLDNEGKQKQRIQTYEGLQTDKYKEYYKQLVKSKNLINISLNKKYLNSFDCLEEANRILYELKMSLIQDVEQLGFNWKGMPDPSNKYLNNSSY